MSRKVQRNQQIMELRKNGLTYVEIGKRYGITPVRCRQIVQWFERERRRREVAQV